MKKTIELLEAKKTTVFKKASQLSTLCGVDVAMIMFHKDDSNPDVFCSKPDSINAVISKYLSHSKHQKADIVSKVAVPDLSARIRAVNERIDLLRSVPATEPKLDDNIGFSLDDVDFDLDNIDFCFDDNLDLDFGIHNSEEQGVVNNRAVNSQEQDVKKTDDRFDNIGFSLDNLDFNLDYNFGFDKIEEQGLKKTDGRFDWFNQLVSC